MLRSEPPLRIRLIEYLKDKKRPVSVRQLAERFEKNPEHVRTVLRVMELDGMLLVIKKNTREKVYRWNWKNEYARKESKDSR